MSANSKPRKAHRPRQIAMPHILDVRMTADAHPDLALELHLAIVGLIEAPTITSCNWLSHKLCTIAGGMSHANMGNPLKDLRSQGSIAISSAIRAIEAIVDRHDAYGVVKVSDIEAKTLRTAAGQLDSALAHIPHSCYQRAVGEVNKLVGA